MACGRNFWPLRLRWFSLLTWMLIRDLFATIQVADTFGRASDLSNQCWSGYENIQLPLAIPVVLEQIALASNMRLVYIDIYIYTYTYIYIYIKLGYAPKVSYMFSTFITHPWLLHHECGGNTPLVLVSLSSVAAIWHSFCMSYWPGAQFSCLRMFFTPCWLIFQQHVIWEDSALSQTFKLSIFSNIATMPNIFSRSFNKPFRHLLPCTLCWMARARHQLPNHRWKLTSAQMESLLDWFQVW